ncbi:MAG TPA: RIP metalloprotease RseP, partial [Planctomycetes bacterium]|nr:RIP metalloprotease RseP [Planctomycetota bacterium]
MVNLIIVLLGIGAVILVHELGHFLAARYAGVRVETFSIGFGPRLFGWKRGSVDYRVSLIPLGGYVKMAGEEPGSGAPAEGDLGSKTVGQRLLIFSAGVIMNFLFALVGFAVAFSVGVPFRPPVLGRIVKGGPAWEAGIPEGSRVLAVGETRVLSFADISTSVALGGDRVVFTILPPGEKTPRKVEVRPYFDKATGFNRILVEPPMEDKVFLHVAPGGPAAKAGLKEGDELLLVDGKDARKLDPKALAALLENPRPLRLTVARKDGSGRVSRMEVTVKPVLKDGPYRMGVQALTRKIKALRRADPLVARSGLRKGDVILQAGGKTVYTRKDLEKILSEARGPVTFLVRRPAPPAEGTGKEGRVSFRKVRLTVRIPGPAAAGEFLENIAFDPDGTYVLPGKGSPAAKAGLRPGDRILAVDSRPIEEWKDLVAAVSASRDGRMTVQVERGGKVLKMTVQAEKMKIPDYGFQPY